jgi:hypothetical protein
MPLRSSWLYNDYGIGAGYYDTRFNNDLTVSLFKIAGLYDDPRFTAAAEAQCGWFLKYAEQYSTIITGDNLYGLLVEDYCQADSTRGHTHTSLNHQLQEMKALLAAYHATGKSDYQDLAYRMLNGITATESLWTDSQQGLVYALLNGKAVGHDYPYLTYNDLYEFQLMLPQRDAALDRLMLAKRLQMERDGITGYYR